MCPLSPSLSSTEISTHNRFAGEGGERRGERTGRSFAVGEICTELDFAGMDLAPTPPSFFAGPSSPLCPWIWPWLLACCAYAPTDLNLATRMAKAYSWPHAGPSFSGFFAFCYVPCCYAGGFELGHSHAQCLFLAACWISWPRCTTSTSWPWSATPAPSPPPVDVASGREECKISG